MIRWHLQSGTIKLGGTIQSSEARSLSLHGGDVETPTLHATVSPPLASRTRTATFSIAIFTVDLFKRSIIKLLGLLYTKSICKSRFNLVENTSSLIMCGVGEFDYNKLQ